MWRLKGTRMHDTQGYDQQGYDRSGFDREGYHRATHLHRTESTSQGLPLHLDLAMQGAASSPPAFGSTFGGAFFGRALLVIALIFLARLGGQRMGVDPEFATSLGVIGLAAILGGIFYFHLWRERNRTDKRQQVGLQRLGFTDASAYEKAVAARKRRLGRRVHRKLARATLDVLRKHTGKQAYRHPHQYEVIFQHIARTHGHNGRLN